MHPSNLGKMNGPLNANVNALIAHVKNGNTNGPIGGMAALAVADPEKYPEFAGNVFTVDTRPFQRSPEESPRPDGSHWHNNGHTLWLIGKGMGDGMVNMLKKQ